MIPAAVKGQLGMLRESFLHSNGMQDWVGRWWSQLQVNDRRTLLALSGLDDSQLMASRSWRMLRQEDRDALLIECKRVGRLVEGLRWA